MAAASHRRATAMSQSAAGTGSVTESKDILFGVGWHPRGNVLASIPVVGGTTPAQGRSQAFSATGGGGPGGRTAKVFYETKDGNFVRQAEYDRLKRDEEQRKRDEQRQRNVLQNLLSGVVSLDDDAKLYDDMIRYVTGKTVHLTRLLSAVCAGVSFMLLFMLFFIGAPTNDAYTAALTAAAPTVAATSNGTSTSALATPFGGRCTLDTGDCFALFAYVTMYKPVSYFFLVSSLAGCLMSLAPLVYTTAQGAPHRGVAKRYALLQRTIADPNTEPHTRRAATDALATLQMPESGLLSLVRYFFNPTFLAFVGAYACTVAVMSVEFDRQTSVLMVGITPSLYNRLKLSIIVRAGFHLLATLVSMGTASANGQ